MNVPNEIIEYYDSIATTYDASRFANSYGAFIDAQERKILSRFLEGAGRNVVELACGTGRLLNYASVGVDASNEMLREAAKKYPDKQLLQAPAHQLPFDSGSVDAVYCFHLVMHLDVDYLKAVFAEFSRILRPGGALIFDFPSATRRRLARRNQGGWHGNSSFSVASVSRLIPSDLHLVSSTGIMLAPVHILPSAIRKATLPVDSLMCRTFLKYLASYLVVKFVKE